MPPLSSSADPALAAVIRRLREERGATQEEVAYNAGLTTGSYARIELGQSNPTWSSVRRIVTALGVTLVQLAEAVEREKG